MRGATYGLKALSQPSGIFSTLADCEGDKGSGGSERMGFCAARLATVVVRSIGETWYNILPLLSRRVTVVIAGGGRTRSKFPSAAPTQSTWKLPKSSGPTKNCFPAFRRHRAHRPDARRGVEGHEAADRYRTTAGKCFLDMLGLFAEFETAT
jgi:hypothetical protein